MLEDVIDRVNVRLAAAGVKRADGVTALVASVGPENLAHEDASPRIIVVPTSDSFGPPFQVNENPRSIWTCSMGARVHIWGRSYRECRAIGREFIKQLYGAVGGDMRVSRGTFNPDPAVTAYGREYILDITVDEPITLSAYDPTFGTPGASYTMRHATPKQPIAGTLEHP